MTLAGATRSMLERALPRERVGVVSAVDVVAGTCTVRVAGADVAGLPWVGGTPLAGQVARVVQGVVSILSPDPLVVPDQVTVLIEPAETVAFQFRTLRATNQEWRSWGAPQDEPWSPEWPTWDIQQGAWMSTSPSFLPYSRRATLVRYDVAGALPAGATDVIMRMHFDRNFELTSNRAIVTASPVAHGIDYDPLPDHSAQDPTTAPEPVSVPGFDEWRPGGVVPGESASFEVPADYRDALLDGTLTGFLFASPDTADDAWFRSGSAPYRNGYLFLTYTPAPEEL